MCMCVSGVAVACVWQRTCKGAPQMERCTARTSSFAFPSRLRPLPSTSTLFVSRPRAPSSNGVYVRR